MQLSTFAGMIMDPEPSMTPARLDGLSEDNLERQIPLKNIRPKVNGSLVRSCFACNRKKIRCDKNSPCASCTRANKACSYPSLGPRVRRSKKTIMAEMVSRISSLERSLAEATDQRDTGLLSPRQSISETTNTTSSVQPGRKLHHEHSSQKPRKDIIVRKGSSSQYFNEVLLSTVIEEVSFTNIGCKSTASSVPDHWCRKEPSNLF